MNSVIQEIEKICNGKTFRLIDSFLNRYSVICREADGTKTAYCFSVPIRIIGSNGVVDLRFSHRKNGSVLNGSKTIVTVTDRTRLSNDYQHLDLSTILGNLKNNSENYVMQAPSANSPVVISTGDSSYAPQILEVKLR